MDTSVFAELHTFLLGKCKLQLFYYLWKFRELMIVKELLGIIGIILHYFALG